MTPASTVFLFLVFCGFSQVTFATALAVRLLPYFRHNLSGLFLHSNDWELFFMNCVEFVPFLISLYDVNFGLIAEYGGGRVEHQLVDGSIVCVQLFWLDYHNFFTYHLPFPLLGVYAFMDDPFCAGQILKRSTSLIEDSSYTLLNIKNNNSDTFCFSNKYTRNNYQAVGFYIEMLGTGECYPNGFTFLPLISYCAKLGCLSSGQMLHGQSVKLGVSSVLMSAPSFDGLDCEIPEFVFHVRGTSAKEIFWVTHGISQLTCADFFQTLGVKTPVMVRFSTAIHEYGSPETLRNSRGFAVKSYTRESHIQEKWRILFGDSGVPPDYRHMEGSGVDTYTLINKAWMVHFLKSHWKPTYGVKCLLEKGASKVIYHDLEDFNPLDVTMTWPEDDVPLQPVGLLVLNDNIDNFFAESEQLAFCPGPIDPKVHHYSDKPLRTRILSYAPPTSHSLQKLRGSHHLEYKVDLKAWGMIHLSIGGTTTSNSSTLQSNLSPTSPQAFVRTIPKKHMRDEPQS